MFPILDFIAKQTAGKVYKSARYCLDSESSVPTINYDDSQQFILQKDRFGETDTSLKTTKNLTVLTQRISRTESPLFRYFLDGSRRIYKVDDIAYQKRIFPIVGGQIGVACCERQNPDQFGRAALERHLVLSLPTLAATDSTGRIELVLGNLLSKLNQLPRLQQQGVQFSELLAYSSDRNDQGREEYLNRGTAKIQDKMIEYEKRTVDNLARRNLLTLDRYLLKDGSLQYPTTRDKSLSIETARFRSNFRRVVGVSKSFNPEFSKDRRGQSNAATIAELPTFHRTPVAFYDEASRSGNVAFAIWYVRIRPATHNESPFAGVLKVEKILVTEEERDNGLDTAEVDRITAHLINERNPVCYGNDQRWANHLYPVFLTESYIKSQYISDLHFINLF
jgi:hypothetical protein